MKFIAVVTVPAIVAAITLSACSVEEPTATKPDTKSTATQAAKTKSAVKEAPAPKPKPTMTSGQENAVESAENYLNTASFSKSGLIEQLQFEDYSSSEARFAVSHIDVSWKQQAVGAAKGYLESSSFSRQSLTEQLEFEGYTPEQAAYGVSQAY